MFRVFLQPETVRINLTGRLLRQPVQDAWLPWMLSAGWKLRKFNYFRKKEVRE
jgi:hypothetical protein